MKYRKLPLLALCLLLCGCVKRTAESPAPEMPAEDTTPAPIVISGREWSAESREVILDGDLTLAQLRSALPAFPLLERVEWKDCPLSVAERKALREEYPGLVFDWSLSLGSTEFSTLDKEITLAGERKDVPALAELLPLTAAESVDLSGWTISKEEAAELRAAAPETRFIYTVTIYGRDFSTDDKEIDLSELALTDTAELEAALVHFNGLEKVLMLHCGLDNDTMDALNARHEGVQFVWLVQVMTVAIRSDRTYFSIYNPDELCYSRESVTNLRYCHDLIAVDLGHCGIGQEDLEFVRGCPKLQFLILAECYVRNLEPLRACPELRYLEAFKTYLTDISALLDCPKLTDLNLCYVPSLGPECVPILKEMTQLEHLWFCDANFSSTLIIELRDTLADTEFIYHKGPESTGAGWRDHDIYYEMRDALNMHYMQ